MSCYDITRCSKCVKRFRRLKQIRLISSLLVLLFAIIWGISTRFGIIWHANNGGLLITGGIVKFGWGPGVWFDQHEGWFRRVKPEYGFKRPRLWNLGANVGMGELPFWILTMIPSVLAIFTMKATIRRVPGPCAHCGFDLTGNTTGVCPECGTSIAEQKIREIAKVAMSG